MLLVSGQSSKYTRFMIRFNLKLQLEKSNIPAFSQED